MVVGLIIGGIVLFLLLVVVLFIIGIYNGLVRKRNEKDNSWSQIDVQLKRRHDLIPNLVETVKGYAAHERQTLEAVTQARNIAQGAVGKGVGTQAEAEAGLSGALARLMAVVERYPDLKANQNFLSLQEELSSTENKISFSRQYYNDSVLRYNNQVQMFPSSIVAGMTGFKLAEFFEIEAPAEREVPKVKFT